MKKEQTPYSKIINLLELFQLNEDTDEVGTIESVRKGVEFRGTNLWTLIFAIFIASIGLNVNSTAVIIGAMLISPLMGPIVGAGFAVGTNDFDFLKRCLRNLGIATLVSIVTSTIYFSITPINEAQSELLARTTPTIFDVLIALFGGATGIIANTRKEKGNAIAGVAIATALMPPLCTAGYGLAQGNWSFFLGAFYLYFINSIFIAIATFVFVRYLNFRKVDWGLYKEQEAKVRTYLMIFALITIIPSIYTAWEIVQSSLFKSRANLFITQHFDSQKTKIIEKNIISEGKKKIELTLIGAKISEENLQNIKNKLPQYKLENVELSVLQDLSSPNPESLKYEILSEIYKNTNVTEEKKLDQLRKELEILYPELKSFSLTESKEFLSTENKYENFHLFLTHWSRKPPERDKERLRQFVEIRMGLEKIKMMLE
ncbi:DUF389 domain-containing protein [Leptospira ilyithenensis]|uniref:DUF389 domain-containing protein n=1 Tax=Leptospira ilyithenensis TaxID=2484901 RepID=A0A4R9LT30_9LEPT|nr:DUF389 domain-containing protein [Leptospira ilyithenensis]TGN10584.1 DUF389 domain-containing protein [Leptospira ilyithenensis]